MLCVLSQTLKSVNSVLILIFLVIHQWANEIQWRLENSQPILWNQSQPITRLKHRTRNKTKVSWLSPWEVPAGWSKGIFYHLLNQSEGELENQSHIKFVMRHFQTSIIIGLTNDYFMILTNQKLCYYTDSTRGEGMYIISWNTSMHLWNWGSTL